MGVHVAVLLFLVDNAGDEVPLKEAGGPKPCETRADHGDSGTTPRLVEVMFAWRSKVERPLRGLVWVLLAEDDKSTNIENKSANQCSQRCTNADFGL